MPQASERLRNKMNEYFGDRINGPFEFLISQGFVHDEGTLWKPGVSLQHLTDKEYDCLVFLVQECGYNYGEMNA